MRPFLILLLIVLGNCSSLSAQLKSDTLYSYQQLMQFFTDAKDNADAWRLAEVHGLFGDYHFYTADYENAFKSYTKSIERYESLGDFQHANEVKMALADFYIFQNQYKGAKRIYESVIDYYVQTNNRPQLAKAYLELSRIYRQDKNYQKEIYFLNKSVNINQSLRDTILDITINLEKANSYLNLGENNKGLGNAEKALSLSRQLNHTNYTSKSLLALGEAYNKKNKPKLAIPNLRKSLQLTDKDNAIQLRDLYKEMSESYRLQSQFDTAYWYLTQYAVLQDSLSNANRMSIASKLSRQYESEKKDELISELSQERESAQTNVRRQRTLLISALIGFLAVLAAIYWLIRFFQKQIRTKELLTLQKEEINKQKITELENNMKIESMHAMIEGQEAERERVAKDLHDSLGGLLSTVKLQFDSLESKMEEVKDISNYKNANRLLDTACQEVRDIARNMQPSALLNLGLVAAVKDLINRIDDPEKRIIDFQHYGLESKLENTVALTIYRLVQELLNNSLKHAQASEILVQLTKEENEFIIMVEDDGVGFDVEGVKKGMGTDNILSRVNFLKGDLSVHSEKGKGTTTVISIPLGEEEAG